MFKFWHSLINPLFQAIQPKVVVEIGALDGNNTKNILATISSDCTLHIIDPLPTFDFKNIKSSQVFFHQDTSLHVIPHLPSFDIGIIDGDHNWYTVFHELKGIENIHQKENASFPLLIFHDVGWPYGYRDMYYDPSTIPVQYRHQFAAQGIVPNHSGLVMSGFNRTLNNAFLEGGERNGVLTAIEDFIAESKSEYIFKTIPAYFGFGFLLSKERSAKYPEINNALNKIFSSETLLQVIEKQEDIFLNQAVQTHELSYQLEKSNRKFTNTIPTTSEASNSVKISFVVITYNMQREAERTLTSLTKEYQEGVEGLNYEVIVVDNGSSEPLEKDTVEALGENFRYYYLEDASESPAHAINFGAKKAAGEFLAIMIDGAHILSPGVLYYASRAIAQYEEPIIAVQYWYLGPGPQNITTMNGYNQDVEDELIKSVDWPNNGYGLYSISEKISKNNSWLEALFESNCLFVRKRLFDAIGGADENFDYPGGGFLNADIYKEAAEFGGVQVVTILGEGSFHQVHGGTTTNTPPKEQNSLIRAYRDQYKKIRGHEYQMANTQIQYIGHMPREARKPGSASYHLREKYNPVA